MQIVPPKASRFRANTADVSLEETAYFVALMERVAAIGILTVRMGDLRDGVCAGKLGPNVRTKITFLLQDAGIGHYPAELPMAQKDVVRLFLSGSDVERIFTAVLSTGANDTTKSCGRH